MDILNYNCRVCITSSFNDKLKTRYVRPDTASSSGVNYGVAGAGALLDPLLPVLLTVLLRCRGPLVASVGLGPWACPDSLVRSSQHHLQIGKIQFFVEYEILPYH